MRLLQLGACFFSFLSHATFSETLQIQADHSLECRDQEGVCIAKGHARAQRGTVTIRGECLKIYFTKKGQKRIILALESIGQGELQDPSGKVSAEHLYYNMKTQTLHATGKGLSLRTPSFHLTARTWLRYCHQTHQGEALGDVCLTQGERSLQAHSLQAQFQPVPGKATSHLSLQWAKAQGKVSLFQGSRAAHADRAFYDAQVQKAYLEGHVSLIQGSSFAQGEKGVFDFVSKRAALSSPRGRVYFLITPHQFTKEAKDQ